MVSTPKFLAAGVITTGGYDRITTLKSLAPHSGFTACNHFFFGHASSECPPFWYPIEKRFFGVKGRGVGEDLEIP